MLARPPSMATLSPTIRFCYPKLHRPFIRPFSIPKTSNFILNLYSPVSFQPLSNPSPSSHHRPIRAQTQNATAALPPNLQEIVALFQSVPDPKSKYQQLLHYANQLPPYPPQFKTNDYRVRGCVSQVWVRAYPDPNDPSKVRFDADSDSSLTKGLAALLVLGLSGESPSAVATVSPEFVQLLGLRQSLTPSRNNGFLNMLKLMQEKAAEMGGLKLNGQGEILMAEMDDSGGENGGSGGNLETENEGVNSSFDESESSDETPGIDGNVSGGRRGRIREKIGRELNPIELEVEDVSHLHAGHAGVRGNGGGETHFNLKVVSEEFEGKSMVKRHRLVYAVLREELDSGLHALSIVAKTPSEV